MNVRGPIVAGLACSIATALPAAAEDLGELTLFGQAYRVQRFDYSQVSWTDPLDPGFRLNLIEVEGAHSLGNDRLLISTDAGDSLLSLKNWVLEVRLRRNDGGEITGLEYVRTVFANDPFNPAYGGFDLSPCGVTINTSPAGLAADGNLLIGDSEVNGVHGYSITTGADLGSFPGGADNNSFDDLAFCPSNNLLYTINEDGYRLVTFTPAGAFVSSTPIPGLAALNPVAIPGSPKGMTFLPDADTVPSAIRRSGGVMLLTLDDNNPGLQVLDLAGGVVATEPLTDNPVLGGASLLEQGAGCGNPLQLEAAAFDAATGTLFLVNEGSFFDCSGFYVLTPLGGCGCAADYNADGGVDGGDVEAFFTEWEQSIGCADVNQDGGIDGGDVEAFFTFWEAGGC